MPKGQRREWADVLAAVRRHRGWALVGRYGSPNSAAATASNLRTGKLAPLEGRWRIVAKRTAGGDGSLVFARYLGD